MLLLPHQGSMLLNILLKEKLRETLFSSVMYHIRIHQRLQRTHQELVVQAHAISVYLDNILKYTALTTLADLTFSTRFQGSQ